MFYLAELITKSYMPNELKKGMLFVNHNILDIDDESAPTLFKLAKDVPSEEKDSFMVINGAPVELYVVDEIGNIIAGPDNIGLWESPQPVPLNIKHINNIFGMHDGLLEIDGTSTDRNSIIPTLIGGKVMLRPPQDEEEEDNNYEEGYLDPDDEVVNGFNHDM